MSPAKFIAPMSALHRAAGLLGLFVAIASFGMIGATVADPAGVRKSKPSVQVETTQSEFDRLMAIARNTRQGTGSKVRRLDIEDRPTIGAKETSLVLIEVASFECPYCRRHWLDTMPALQKSHIDNGRLRYVFVDVVLDPAHRHARAATEAAHCANEQGRYTAFRNHVYRNQKAIDAAFLEAHAKAIGLDLRTFRRCMAAGRYKARVDHDTALARRLRVRGTPSFFWARAEPGQSDVRLVHRISGIRPVDEFARQFDTLQLQDTAATAALDERPR